MSTFSAVRVLRGRPLPGARSMDPVVRNKGVHGNGNCHSHGIPMGFHENGSSFGLLMGMEMGIVLIGMGIAYFIVEK